MSENYYQGTYQVENKSKYIGDKNPSYRSSWEARFCYYLDHNQNVIEWAYEPIAIEYFSPVDKKMHKYFPDFYVKLVDNTQNIKQFIVEVKPVKQVDKPVPPKRKTKKAMNRYINESLTFVVNQSKWDAAKEFCKKYGFEFKIITEKDLF